MRRENDNDEINFFVSSELIQYLFTFESYLLRDEKLLSMIFFSFLFLFYIYILHSDIFLYIKQPENQIDIKTVSNKIITVFSILFGEKFMLVSSRIILKFEIF